MKRRDSIGTTRRGSESGTGTGFEQNVSIFGLYEYSNRLFFYSILKTNDPVIKNSFVRNVCVLCFKIGLIFNLCVCTRLSFLTRF